MHHIIRSLAVLLALAPVAASAQSSVPSMAPSPAMSTMKSSAHQGKKSGGDKKAATKPQSTTPGAPNYSGSSPLGSAEKKK